VETQTSAFSMACTSPGKCCQPYLDVAALLQAPHGSLVILFVDVNHFAQMMLDFCNGFCLMKIKLQKIMQKHAPEPDGSPT